MKKLVPVLALLLGVLLAGSGAAFAQQTTTSPFGPTTPGYPMTPGSSFLYNPSYPAGMGYSPYAPTSFGYPSGVNPFSSTMGTPGSTFGSPSTTLGAPTASLFSPFLVGTPGGTPTTGLTGQATGSDSSMFNAMFGLNPAAMNPFTLFGSPTTLNPFSMFFGNTAIAPSPVVPSAVTTPSTVLTPPTTPTTPAQTPGG